MKRKNTTRSALFSSVIALMLCVSMLVGTTFAWFTDSVTSAGNIIKSGSLEVTMEWKDATATGAQQTYKDASEGAIFDYDLWEPGYVEAKNVKIGNVGTLALKYQLTIAANGEVSKLADVIDVYYAEGEYTLASREMTELTHIGTLTEVLAGMKTTAAGDLKATESDTVTIALKMQETAGNEYQNLSIGSEFAVQLWATQLTAEYDSFDDQYDVKATYLNQDADGAWLINNMDELFFFSADVNNGNDYKGQTVKLTADIDLAGYNWLPIGSGDVNGKWIGFNGIFDGQNHTVSNIRVTKGGGWNGLFGLVGRGTTTVEEKISNLTVKNVVIENANRMSGGIVGQIYGNLENCHAENVTITAIPNWVEKDQSYDNGDKVGGLVGWLGDNGNYHYIKNCSAKNVTLKGYRDVGGITGYIGSSSIVEDCAVDTVAITIDQATNYYGDKDTNAGAIVGRIYKQPVTVQNNTEANVTIEIITPVFDEAGLAEALQSSGTYVLMNDLAPTATMKVPSGVEVVLDMNGKTIAGQTSATGKNSILIDVYGDLTVVDGTLTTIHTGSDMGWNNCTEVFHLTFSGKLTLDNVTVENLGGTAMAYAIDLTNIYAADDSKLTVTNSTLKSTYIPVRVFNNGNGVHNVEIKESKLEGKLAFWVQYYDETDDGMGANTAAKRANLNIDIYNNGNTFVCAEGKTSPILYGFNVDYYFDASGALVKAAASQAELNTAVSSGDAVSVALSDGSYNMPGSSGDVTISGTKDTVIDLGKTGAENVTFNGVTVKTTGYYGGLIDNDTIVYNDCTIDGTIYLYGEKVVFNNCTFDLEDTNDYIWVYATKNAEFNNCTFNTMGKALLVFQDGSTVDQTVKVEGCTFNASAAAYNWNHTIHISAVSMDGSQGGTYNVILNNNNVDSDFNGLWQDKTSAGNITVTVDGVKVLEP